MSANPHPRWPVEPGCCTLHDQGELGVGERCGAGHWCCSTPEAPPLHDHFLSPEECPSCANGRLLCCDWRDHQQECGCPYHLVSLLHPYGYTPKPTAQGVRAPGGGEALPQQGQSEGTP